MTDLKLGPLPNHRAVRVTVMIPQPLKEELDAYAAEHGRLFEPVQTAALTPHMLEAFLRADRAWCRRRQARRRKAVDDGSSDPQATDESEGCQS